MTIQAQATHVLLGVMQFVTMWFDSCHDHSTLGQKICLSMCLLSLTTSLKLSNCCEDDF